MKSAVKAAQAGVTAERRNIPDGKFGGTQQGSGFFHSKLLYQLMKGFSGTVLDNADDLAGTVVVFFGKIINGYSSEMLLNVL